MGHGSWVTKYDPFPSLRAGNNSDVTTVRTSEVLSAFEGFQKPLNFGDIFE